MLRKSWISTSNSDNLRYRNDRQFQIMLTIIQSTLEISTSISRGDNYTLSVSRGVNERVGREVFNIKQRRLDVTINKLVRVGDLAYLICLLICRTLHRSHGEVEGVMMPH